MYFPFSVPKRGRKRSAAQPQTIYSEVPQVRLGPHGREVHMKRILRSFGIALLLLAICFSLISILSGGFRQDASAIAGKQVPGFQSTVCKR